MNEINEFLRISKSSLKALEHLGKTVVKLNDDALLDACEILKNHTEVITIGVKNSGQIDKKLIKKLVGTGKYIWHTIDYMADGGRAIDEKLLNPLTFRPMTGSSSATAINVLLGINDIGIGTDGGGSVLAPALSLNLFSIMAKGMGLRGNTERVSTDGISFTPGIGIISQSFGGVRDAVFSILDIKETKMDFKDVRIAACKHGSITLPDSSDMNEKLSAALYRLREKGANIDEVEMPDFKDRAVSIEKMKQLFTQYDLVITYEGPVDLCGTGDSVFGTMGPFARANQDRAGKYMVRIANMLDATSVTVPGPEVASGLVITSGSGMDCGMKTIMAAEEVKDMYNLPGLYYNYFKNGYLRRKNDLIFSLEGV